jgi:exoribonuclease R
MSFRYHPEWTQEGDTGYVHYLAFDRIEIIDNDIPINNMSRAMDGDEVYYQNGEITGVKTRSKRVIVGILQVTELKKYGKNKRGHPIYKMTPLSWKFPTMYVASSHRDLRENLLVLVDFLSWSPFEKYPTGSLNRILGGVSDEQVEDLALLYKNSLFRKPIDLKDLVLERPPEEERVEFGLECNITSIDPIGSEDLDDAFHITENMVYVHIADVDHYIKASSAADTLIAPRVTTIYGPTISHMLDSRLAENVLSLKPGQRKAVMTIELLYTPEQGLVPHKVYPAYIWPKRALTYEVAQELLDAAKDLHLETVSRYTNEKDTHKIIEYLMVKCNAYVGDLLKEHGKSGLYRVCQTDEPAKYVFANSLTPGPVRHAALNLDNYTHFTSPIRRYADVLVARCLKGHNYESARLQAFAIEINSFNEKTRRYYRDLDILKLYRTVQEKGGLWETEGTIRTIRDTRVTVYLPELNMDYSYPLFDDRLKFNLAVQQTDTMFSIGDDIWLPFDRPIRVLLRSDPSALKLYKKVILKLLNI